MRRAFLFLTALLIASTSLEVLSEPSNTAKPLGLAYYSSVVKKRLQGKPLTRKEAQTLSSLKKLTVISLAITGTLGGAGLYRLYAGHSTSKDTTPIPPEATPEAEEEDAYWEDDPDYVYEPSREEEAQLQRQYAPFSAADGQDDTEVIQLESQEVPEGLAGALKQRRGKVSHNTRNERRRKRRRARLTKDSFTPKGTQNQPEDQ